MKNLILATASIEMYTHSVVYIVFEAISLVITKASALGIFILVPGLNRLSSMYITY